MSLLLLPISSCESEECGQDDRLCIRAAIYAVHLIIHNVMILHVSGEWLQKGAVSLFP